MADFSHLNENSEAQMVDIGGKQTSSRTARVSHQVQATESLSKTLKEASIREITSTARIAGIQASKLTSQLIPMCHQIPLDQVTLTIEYCQEKNAFVIESTAKSATATGVEMEAFVAAELAALTIYDMIKGVCPEAVLGPCQLEQKKGGKLGLWQRSKQESTF